MKLLTSLCFKSLSEDTDQLAALHHQRSTAILALHGFDYAG
jgi:hypothetical protein